MNVRAKFTCTGVQNNNVELWPVTADTPENKTWSQYTPCGKITMLIDNPPALAAFVVGKEYYVDFTPAETVPNTSV